MTEDKDMHSILGDVFPDNHLDMLFEICLNETVKLINTEKIDHIPLSLTVNIINPDGDERLARMIVPETPSDDEDIAMMFRVMGMTIEQSIQPDLPCALVIVQEANLTHGVVYDTQDGHALIRPFERKDQGKGLKEVSDKEIVLLHCQSVDGRTRDAMITVAQREDGSVYIKDVFRFMKMGEKSKYCAYTTETTKDGVIYCDYEPRDEVESFFFGVYEVMHGKKVEEVTGATSIAFDTLSYNKPLETYADALKFVEETFDKIKKERGEKPNLLADDKN